MTDQAPIQTRPDGSIDTAFYMARGRRLRSEQAHRVTAAATAPRQRGTVLVALVAFLIWPFAG